MLTKFTTFLILLALVILSIGCASRPLPPANLAEGGWQISESVVIWRPRRTSPELLGELLVASHPNGRQLIQLSKQSLPLITAQANAKAWMITSTLRPGRFGGSLPATDSVPWFLLQSLPPHPPASSRWRVGFRPNGYWRLGNSRTGEYVEGPLP